MKIYSKQTGKVIFEMDDYFILSIAVIVVLGCIEIFGK